MVKIKEDSFEFSFLLFYIILNRFFDNMQIQLSNWSFDKIEFQIDINKLNDYQYITIYNDNLLNDVYNIIHNYIHQCDEIYVPNLGRAFISDTGFFDYYNNQRKMLSWKNFKEYLNGVIYTYKIEDNVLIIYPLHYNSYKYSEIQDKIYIIK